VRQLRAARCEKIFRETASGPKTDRTELAKLLAKLDADDVLMVTRLDRLARSTRDLLNTLGSITDRKAGFRSLGGTWANATTADGRLMLTVLGCGVDRWVRNERRCNPLTSPEIGCHGIRRALRIIPPPSVKGALCSNIISIHLSPGSGFAPVPSPTIGCIAAATSRRA
jgi:Resolvase, N terminal domain